MNHPNKNLESGMRVKGVHLFGNPFIGTIESVRPHTVDRIRFVVFIKFDTPTDLGLSPKTKTGDIRQGICTEVDPPQFKGDTKWQGGSGEWFEIIEPAAVRIMQRFRTEIMGLSDTSCQSLVRIINEELKPTT